MTNVEFEDQLARFALTARAAGLSPEVISAGFQRGAAAAAIKIMSRTAFQRQCAGAYDVIGKLMAEPG
jgi:hypothetical protein